MNSKEKKRCPECGELIEIDSRNCKFCGAFIAKTSEEYHYESKDIKRSNKEAVVENIKICNNCGQVNRINAIVCNNCSESLINAKIVDKNKDYIRELRKKESKKEQRFMIIRISYFSAITFTITVLMILTFVGISKFNSNIELNRAGQNIWSSNANLISSGEYVRNFFFAYIFLFISIIDNFFPDALFFLHFSNYFMVKDAEPSDYYYFITKIGSYLMSFGILVFISFQYYSLWM
ncbi:hypothetical protein [Clostridium sediminicola]|uniref:hypothetical protein n=1 Tax=Clostridium sediminicola TaxID=3114879 RepID=UPI003D168FFA